MSLARAPQPTERAVEGFFDADAENWLAMYSRTDDVFAVIHQLRQRIALDWVRRLGLPAGARVLEVGCGAGLASLELARLGLKVTAVDSTRAMVALTRANAERAGLGDRVETRLANAHALPEPDGGYELVVALGVLPWLAQPARGVSEMARVLRPGGWLIANVDNRRRLNVLLDPRYTPALARLRAGLRRRRRAGLQEPALPQAVRHTEAEYRALLAAQGLAPVRTATFGFGPFTLFGRRILPGRAGVAAHRALQRLGELGVPVLKATGTQCIALAWKPR